MKCKDCPAYKDCEGANPSDAAGCCFGEFELDCYDDPSCNVQNQCREYSKKINKTIVIEEEADD